MEQSHIPSNLTQQWKDLSIRGKEVKHSFSVFGLPGLKRDLQHIADHSNDWFFQEA